MIFSENVPHLLVCRSSLNLEKKRLILVGIKFTSIENVNQIHGKNNEMHEKQQKKEKSRMNKKKKKKFL